MKKVLKDIEMIIDASIPYLVILLLFIIITPFVAEDFYHHYESLFHSLDYMIIAIFALDLIFKYVRIRKFKPFLKKYWLDILAVFPFYLIFRIFEESYLFLRAGEQLTESQPFLHIVANINEAPKLFSETAEIQKITRETEALGKIRRVNFLGRFARPIARSPRILKAAAYYEEPKHKNSEFNKIIKYLK
jgi:hypothetical protein